MRRRNLMDLMVNSKFEFVDLGLSVEWATCNLGSEKPTDCGYYFAYGETDGFYDATERKFNWREL